MAELLQQIVNGLVLSSVYVLVALGATLVFGLTRLINFAHGEFLAIAAMITWLLTSLGWAFVPAALVGVSAAALSAAVVERVVFRPTMSVPLNGFIVSLGLIAISQALLAEFIGVEPRSVSPPVEGGLQLGSVTLSWARLLIVAVTIVLVIGLLLALDGTTLGRRVRATAQDEYAARLLGIDVTRVVAIVFVTGSALAGAAGVLMITVFAVSPFSGLTFVLKGFIAAIVGGLGNVRGAALAGLLLGMIESLGGAYVSLQWQNAFAYIVLIVVLALRPTGLLRGADA